MASDTVAIKCQYSRLIIPGDPAYAGTAAAYTGSVAEKMGFDPRDVEDIKQCTERVVAWAINYSLAENEKASVEVSCEVVPEGFKITVNDRGVPFEPSALKEVAADDLSGFFHLDGHMDEVQFNNLGPGGKEVLLIKYARQGRITDFFNACELELNEDEAAPKPPHDRTVDYIVRAMKADEAIGVSKCVYKGYGYTYPHEHIYYPDKLAEMNKNNRMFSAVAVTAQGDIVGHCALLYEDAGQRLAEMGLGVVKPEYRGMGCFNKLTAFLVEKARADHLKALYVRAVAVHRYSQQTAARFGLQECALMLAYIPPSVVFKHVGKQQPQRVTVLIGFRYLDPPPPPIIYPPQRHKNIIISIYDHLKIKPFVKSSATPAENAFEAESHFHIKVLNSMRCAHIVIEKYGKHIVREISQSLTELCLKRIEVLNLYLDLSDPQTGSVSEKLEEIGFFFSGILPGIMPNGSDALILQYLDNVFVDYHAVQVYSEMAEKLLDYVRGRHFESKF